MLREKQCVKQQLDCWRLARDSFIDLCPVHDLLCVACSHSLLYLLYHVLHHTRPAVLHLNQVKGIGLLPKMWSFIFFLPFSCTYHLLNIQLLILCPFFNYYIFQTGKIILFHLSLISSPLGSSHWVKYSSLVSAYLRHHLILISQCNMKLKNVF